MVESRGIEPRYAGCKGRVGHQATPRFSPWEGNFPGAFLIIQPIHAAPNEPNTPYSSLGNASEKEVDTNASLIYHLDYE